MSEFKVFYSWQSDLPNPTNRGFIGDALQKACKQVASNPEVDESPRVDQDTLGLAGSPSIPQAIMEKIDACQAFVADVSFCYKAEDGTLAPNPNVVYELGYAVARLGWDRIVLVVNEEFGKVEQLPFDMEKRRAIPYVAKEGEANRSETKKALVARLAANIEAITKRQPIVTRVTPTEAARDAVSSQSPDRISKVRAFIAWLLQQLDELNPGATSPQSFVDSLDSSKPFIEAFSVVVEAASIADDPASIREVWRAFEKVLERYDVPSRYSGVLNETLHDWWRFHGHEMCVIVVSHLQHERKLPLIEELLSEEFVQRRWAESRNSQRADFRDLSDYVRSIYNWNQGLMAAREQAWVSPHGELLKRRYESWSELVPEWKQICEADLLLALVCASREPSQRYEHWQNWTHIYLGSTPRFILSARRNMVANQLLSLFQLGTIPELVAWLKEQWAELDKEWKEYFFRRGAPTDDIDLIGSA